jgi:hypothetical protein
VSRASELVRGVEPSSAYLDRLLRFAFLAPSIKTNMIANNPRRRREIIADM